MRLSVLIVGMAGLRLDRSPVRVLASVAAMATTLWLHVLAVEAGHELVAAIASGLFYYGGNAWLCSAHGSRLLRERVGDERAVAIHELYLAVAFPNQAYALSSVAEVSAGSLPIDPTVAGVLAALLFIVGSGVKLWATALTGLDAYYYRGLFLRRAEGELVRRGPYRWLDHPMYGVGYLHGYAVAVAVASLPGLLLALAFHGAIQLFQRLVEQPFVDELVRAQPTGEVSPR